MADTERLNINNLLPDTDYVVQVRAVNDAGHSKWSQKFNFKTIDDTIGGTRKPKTPLNVTLEYGNDKLHAEWDKVNQNTDNTNAKITSYELEWTGVPGGTRIMPVTPTDDARQEYDLTTVRAIALFGALPPVVRIRVRAVNAAGNRSAWSAQASVSPAAPAAPTNAVVEEVNEALKISWDAPADTSNVAGYRVYLSTASGFTPSLANRVYEGKETTFTYTTGTFALHYIVIRSYSIWGNMESSDLTTTGTPKSPFGPDTIAPDVPTGLSATVNRSGPTARALVSWAFSDAGDNEDIQSFAIRYRKAGDTNWFMEFAAKDARTLLVDLPQPYASYEFQISAVDFVANYSAWSGSFTLESGIPGAPPQTSGVTATAGLGSIQLQWTPSTHDDVTYGGYYEVQLATNTGFTTGLLTYQTGDTNISVTGLPQSTVYYYRVRAIDVDGNQGAYSTTANVTTGGVVIPSPTDGNPPASSPTPTVTAGLGYLFVSWSPVANADLVKYEVHVSTTSGFTPNNGTKVAETPGTIVTLENTAGGTALAYGTTYYVKLVAKDADGSAAASAEASGSPTKVGSGDIVTITADQIGTGSLSAAVITVSSTGVIQSANYVANTSGFKLSSSVVDIQSGVVNFGTLAAGTMTATGLSIGAGGRITVDSTGAIQSNNYSSGSTGWKLSATGLEVNGGSVKASAIVGGTFTGGNFVVGSGGSITGTGFTLSSTGLSVTSGSISGAAVVANQMSSSNGAFSINSSGYASFSGAYITGTTIVGSGGIQSNDYSPGTAGWKINATGGMEMNTGTFRGTLSGASGTFSGSVTAGTASLSSGYLTFSGGSYGQLWADVLGFFLVGNGSGSIRLNSSYVYAYPNLQVGGYNGTSGYLSVADSGGSQNFTVSSGGVMSAVTVTVAGTTTSGRFVGNNIRNDLTTIPNARWVNTSSGGEIGWTNHSNSSLRYKKEVETLALSAENVVSLRPVSYELKKKPGDRPEGYRFVGFIAEEMQNLGFDQWLVFDEQGRPDEVDYWKWPVAQQVVLRDHHTRVQQLEDEVKELRDTVKVLKRALDNRTDSR